MLKKSKTGAIIMAWLAVLFISLTLAFWELLRNPNLRIGTADSQSGPLSNIIAPTLVALAILFFVFVLPGAFVIHNWDNSYFGKEGAVRWIVFGIVFGCLAQLQILIPKVVFERVFPSFFAKYLLGLMLSFIVFYASHFFAFGFRPGRNRKAR